MMYEELNPDYRDLLTLLCEEGVAFVIVGAYAVAYHGTPRATGDIDILVRPDDDNASRLWRALVRFGAPMEDAGVVREDFTKPGIVYQIGLPPRRIDLLTRISGVSFDEVWSSRVEVALAGKKVAFIGREALIKNKRATGRGKDLLDLQELQKKLE